MIINPNQYLGNFCRNFQSFQSGGYGAYSGCGYLTGLGNWTGSGHYKASGYIQGNGYFILTGNFSGYVPGYIGDNDFDFIGNGSPRVTYSGNNITGDGLSTLDNYVYYGRNNFSSSGIITGNIVVDGEFSGFGIASGWGGFKVSGYVEESGCMIGNGSISGLGDIVHLRNAYFEQACVDCLSNAYLTGNYLLNGDYFATGKYQGVSSGTTINSGVGNYFVSGIYTGFANQLSSAFGNFTGSGLIRQNVSLDPSIPQLYFGTGNWNGTGWFNSPNNGYYSGQGTSQGVGSCHNIGSLLLSDDYNNQAFGNGCFSGYGNVFQSDLTGFISGLYCTTLIDLESLGCLDFPAFPTDCTSISDFAIHFNYGGDCSVKGLDHN